MYVCNKSPQIKSKMDAYTVDQRMKEREAATKAAAKAAADALEQERKADSRQEKQRATLDELERYVHAKLEDATRWPIVIPYNEWVTDDETVMRDRLRVIVYKLNCIVPDSTMKYQLEYEKGDGCSGGPGHEGCYQYANCWQDPPRFEMDRFLV